MTPRRALPLRRGRNRDRGRWPDGPPETKSGPINRLRCNLVVRTGFRRSGIHPTVFTPSKVGCGASAAVATAPPLQALPRIITYNRRDPLTLPGAVIHRPAPGDWQPPMPERLDEEELADWRAGRDAGSIGSPRMTIGAGLGVADDRRASFRYPLWRQL
jgi:hypothetical protein